MKKILALLMALCMIFALVACGSSQSAAPAEEPAAEEPAEAPAEEEPAEEPAEEEPAVDEVGGDASGEMASGEMSAEPAPAVDSDIKIGLICVHDETIGYDQAHIDGFKTAAAELGLTEDNYIIKTNIPEGPECYDNCVDLAEAGCTLIITDSFGHATYAQQAAIEYPEVEFISMTGDNAAASGLSNFHNMFPHTYESRFVSGVVAGMKLQELIDNDELSDKNYDEDGMIKIGYVGAYPYAEVKSGYTAFFLGIKYVVGDIVSMEVTFTNSWADAAAEQQAGKSLIDDGCVIVSQHADSQGMPTTAQAEWEAGTVCYAVGYNVDMLNVSPDACLTSAQNNWSVFYKYAFQCVMNGEAIPTDYSVGYAEDAVMISELGASCAEGTAEKVEEVIAGIIDGSIQVFDCSTFTVDGENPTSYAWQDTDGDFVPDSGEAIEDGIFYESKFISAPYFGLDIDGITLLN